MTTVSDKTNREYDHGVDLLFVDRWSPRAMSGEPIAVEDLMALFEAARWSPSCFNEQPWRLLYARRDTPQWDTFFSLLVEANQAWCANAAALVVMVSRETFTHNEKPNPTFAYDTGAAWMSLALQGELKGYVVHGMAGFDYAAAAENLNVPEQFSVAAMAAIGMPGDTALLPENYREKEVPSGRRAMSEIVIEGGFQ